MSISPRPGVDISVICNGRKSLLGQRTGEEIEFVADVLGRGTAKTARRSGIGIAGVGPWHVFEPFHRANSQVAREHPGAGLRLAIARRLVDVLGVKLASDPGGGNLRHRPPAQCRSVTNVGLAPRSKRGGAESACAEPCSSSEIV
jgi:hypothetical protein